MVQQFLSAEFRLGQPPFSDLFLYLDSCISSEHSHLCLTCKAKPTKKLCKCQVLFLCPLSILFCLIYSSGSILPSGLYWLVWNTGRFLENATHWWLSALIREWIMIKLPYIRTTRITASERISFFTPSALETRWSRGSNQQRGDTMLWKMKVGGEKS